MRLLDRYLFRELFVSLAYCFIGIQAFVVVFTVFSNTQRIQDSKLHFLDTIEYALGASMEMIWVVLPISLLLALLLTLTTFARHNEITAMRAAGVSLWRISGPYFLVGLGASVALFGLNETLVPRSTEWADRVLHRYVADPDANATPQDYRSYYDARTHRLWEFSAYNVRTAEMTNPKVSWTGSRGTYWEISAERAVFTNGAWMFFKAAEYEQTNGAASEVPVPPSNVLVMPQFGETPADIERDIHFSKYISLVSKKLNIPLGVLWRYLQSHPNLQPAQASNLWTKFDGRLAVPWTCLVVVLIAIPFGAASGRRNLFFGVAGSIFICFGFFVIQQFSLAFGSGGYLPPWLAAWLPNLFFGLTGLALMLKVR